MGEAEEEKNKKPIKDEKYYVFLLQREKCFCKLVGKAQMCFFSLGRAQFHLFLRSVGGDVQRIKM